MGDVSSSNNRLNTTEIYEIRIQGHLDDRRSALFEDLAITRQPDGTTLLCGPLPDQTALHSILFRIRNMNLRLISVNPVEPTLNDQ